ncbi:MAG: CPBP family intramembrane metalloprotease [Syntrophomonadaceae bacterium]|nr:CPBP family intramembrane metalloprotease [Syntrophomonadaceae bacterium]
MSFNSPLALVLFAICAFCLCVAIPQMVKSIEKTLTRAEIPLPPRKILISGIAVQNLFLVIVAVAAGVLLAPAAGLRAPVLEALLSAGSLWESLKPQLLPGIITGFIGIVVFILAYYSFFLPRLDFQTVWAIENQRLNLNLWGRLLYGGIVEEIIARWGIVSILIWLVTLLPGESGPLMIWLAIIISGIAFGLLYLPDYYAAGSIKSAIFFTFIAFMYLWNAIIFGWLFWQYGLEAAIIAHMLYLLIWYPYDMRLNIAKKLESELQNGATDS